jgi:DNA processing protein
MKNIYSKKICWIWLTLSLGFGNEKVWQLIAENQTIEETCRYVQNHDIPYKKDISVQQAKQTLVDCLSRGYSVVCYSDVEYPQTLKDMQNPPSVLYYRGDLSVLNESDILTVVGTRKPQEYTLQATSYICDGLVDEGFIIVSGLAHGVDITSQMSALKKCRPTVAVIACGLDYDYPKGANGIKDDIVAYGGLILTEYPLGQHPYKSHFPKRNRIMAGISKGTLIMEANLESGSLITAEYAKDSGKKIFCLPPSNILSNRYYGQSKYIRSGATVVLHHMDIVRAFRGGDTMEEENIQEIYQSPTADTTTPKPTTTDISPKPTNTQNRPLKPSTDTTATPTIDKYTNLNKDKLSVIQSIQRGNTLLDDISMDTKLDVSELFEIITDLEVEGLIVSSFGNSYTLV